MHFAWHKIGMTLATANFPEIKRSPQETLLRESIFIKYQRYRQISDDSSEVVFDPFIETGFLQLIALLSNF